MGARLSLNSQRANCSEQFEESQNEVCKRQRISSRFWDDWDESARLIPSLPDEMSIHILARLPRIWYFNAKLVSRSWRAALMSGEIYRLRKELGKTEEWLYILTRLDGKKLVWHALDPVSHVWQRLPLMPNIDTEDGSRRGLSSLRLWHMIGSSIIADTIRGWLGRKDALDEIPFCGCAIGAVDGCLYVMGGFCKASATAMKSVWRYDPIVNAWSETTPMSTGRAYCKAGALNDKLYVVGGVFQDHDGLTPHQSAEVFDPCSGTWRDIPSMPFSKALVLPTAFIIDLLKPIATGMMSYRGKLYVPQSLFCPPFFVDVGGEVYDPEIQSWVQMPVGMAEGWPAKQSGTKLGVVVDGDLYALDPSASLDSARIKVYYHQDDAWKPIDGDVPIHALADSKVSCLLAGFIGKLHVITKDVNHNISILQADRRNRPDSSYTSLGESMQELSENISASSGNIWSVVATKNAGPAELVSCLTLDV